MGAEEDILFKLSGAVGRVELNRPKALNALTLAMMRRFDAKLIAWAGDARVKAVVVTGAGERAFCAGGDIRALYEAMGRPDDPLPRDFYRQEYTLNHRIFHYPKPYIALVDGVVMGGGVGVSVHGSHRVVTERLIFAMPETGIGLFPDVGGSYFLFRCPGRIGMYLGLTGARLGPADALYCGLATHYVPRERLRPLATALAGADVGDDARQAVSTVIERFAADPGPAPLAQHRDAIDRCFAARSVEGIMEALQAEGSAWAKETRAMLETKSPTSLKVTFRQLTAGAGLDIAEALTIEFRLTQRFVAGHDFYEGVRAAVIDKDNAPAWKPARLGEVDEAEVDSYFAPLPQGELTF
ncbi:MAG: enoyl-CoA hydratase/isomerase family protein [Alphaproteobacteria bacterium]